MGTPSPATVLLLAGVSALILLAGLWAFRPTLLAIFTRSSPEQVVYLDELNDGGTKLKAEAEIAGTPIMTEFGLGVAAGSNYQVRWKGTCEPGEVPFMRVYSYAQGGVENAVTFRVGTEQETIKLPGRVEYAMVRPTTLKPGGTDWEAIFSSSSQSQNALTLDRVQVGKKIFSRGEIQPGAWSILPLLALPWLAWLLVAPVGGSRRGEVAAAIGGALVVLACLALPAVLPVLAWVTLFVSIVGMDYVVWGRADEFPIRKWQLGLLGFGLVCAALPYRWAFLTALQSLPLQPDVDDYVASARKMTYLYDTGFREPLFVWLLKVWCSITAWGGIPVRVLTVVLALLEGAALWVLARRYLPLGCSMLVMLLYAFNPLLASSAAMGLREELMPLLWLLYLVACWYWLQGARFSYLFAAGLGAALVLTRINAATLVFPIYFLCAWRTRLAWWKPAAVLTVTILLLLPHWMHNKRKFGDAMWSSNVHGVFYRNAEFAGQPGHVTKEQFAEDAYAGPRTTTGQYLFGLHTPGQLMEKSFAGLWRMFFGDVARDQFLRLGGKAAVDHYATPVSPKGKMQFYEWPILLLYALGIVAAFRIRHGWLIPLSMLLFQGPISYPAGASLLGPRHMMNGVPLMLLLAGMGGYAIMILLRRSSAPNEPVRPAHRRNKA